MRRSITCASSAGRARAGGPGCGRDTGRSIRASACLPRSTHTDTTCTPRATASHAPPSRRCGAGPRGVAHAAPTTLAAERAPTRVAAWESTVMWSRLDPATGRYQLMKSVDGGAPVASTCRSAAGGRSTSTSARAPPGRRSPSTPATATSTAWTSRAGGVEGQQAQLARSATERSPTIQRGRIAFVRRNGRVDELRIGSAARAAARSRAPARSRTPSSATGTSRTRRLRRRPTASAASCGCTSATSRTGARQGRLPRTLGRLGLREHHARELRREPRGLHLGAHEHGVAVRQPARALHAARLQARVRRRARRTTSRRPGPARSSERSPRRCSAAARAPTARAPTRATAEGVRYCDVLLTGPLTFGLRP